MHKLSTSFVFRHLAAAPSRTMKDAHYIFRLAIYFTWWVMGGLRAWKLFLPNSVTDWVSICFPCGDVGSKKTAFVMEHRSSVEFHLQCLTMQSNFESSFTRVNMGRVLICAESHKSSTQLPFLFPLYEIYLALGCIQRKYHHWKKLHRRFRGLFCLSLFYLLQAFIYHCIYLCEILVLFYLSGTFNGFQSMATI